MQILYYVINNLTSNVEDFVLTCHEIGSEALIIIAGWDTDQFLVDIQEATMIMLSVIRNV